MRACLSCTKALSAVYPRSQRLHNLFVTAKTCLSSMASSGSGTSKCEKKRLFTLRQLIRSLLGTTAQSLDAKTISPIVRHYS